LLSVEIIKSSSNIEFNTSYLDFYFKIKTIKGEILLIPIPEKGDYTIYLSKCTYTKKNSWSDADEVEIKLTNIYCFNFHNKDDRFKILPSEITDISKILKLISCYQDYINGDYGFLEDGKFYNKYDIENIFEADKKKRNASFTHNEDLLIGKTIDTTIIYYKGVNWISMKKGSESYKGPYYKEKYIIHFLYNSGDEFVQVNIKGFYIDVAEIARVYYKAEIKNYIPEIHEIAPEVTLHGSLSELLDKVSKIVN
jgi:hypothetical protein